MGSLYPTCVKTPKGIEEVERKVHGLPLKARQVLIMVDGKRDLAALQGIFPPETVAGILDELLKGEFIRALSPPKVAEPPPPAKPVKQAPVAENDVERYELARNFMINTTTAFVGMAGSSLIEKIEQTSDLVRLGKLYKTWHDAIALTGDGKKRLPELDQQLLKLLGDLPGESKADVSTLKSAMTAALFDVFGPDADRFTEKVDSANEMSELVALASKYAEVVVGMSGRKKGDAFLARLADAGLAVPVAEAKVAEAKVAEKSPAKPKAPANDSERLEMARNFMINTTNTFIGMAGSTLIDKAENATSITDLRHLYYDWRESMGLAKDAKQRLPELEQKLAALLS